MLWIYALLSVCAAILAVVVTAGFLVSSMTTLEAAIGAATVKTVMNYMPSLGLAISTGDWGKVGSTIFFLTVSIAGAYMARAGFWAALGIAAKLVTPWLLVIQIVIALAVVAYAFIQLAAAGCI